jgi:flagellar biogenesis protein FliO
LRGAETGTANGPPAWQDGASVYLNLSAVPATPSEPQPAAANDKRHLPPPSATSQPVQAKYGDNRDSAARDVARQTSLGLPLHTVYTVVSALAIVIGAFLICAWLLKRGGRAPAAQSLPTDVVSVLGRVPIDTRQVAQLLRVGNKLVLISLTASGAETLTEVTDPVEVDRLVGLCQQAQPDSTTKAFEQVFQQLSREPAPGGFLGSAAAPPVSVPPLDMFRPQLREAARA